MPYRAPELFDVPSHADVDERTDVWSLGCLLFAMMYGYSPFECEFSSSGSGSASPGGGQGGDKAGASVTVVECGYLRVIGKIPEPPPAVRRHPRSVDALVARLLTQQPTDRPYISDVIEEATALAAACRQD